MTTATISERITIDENVKKRAVHFDFPWQCVSRLKKCGPRSGATQAALKESVSLRR